MTRTAAALLAALALGAAAGGVAAEDVVPAPLPAPAFTVGEERAGQEVAVPAGTVFAVELVSASGGGYLWSALPPDSPALELLGAETLPASGGRALGAPALQRFVFRARAPGAAELALVLARPWENVEPRRRFTLKVLVPAD